MPRLVHAAPGVVLWAQRVPGPRPSPCSSSPTRARPAFSVARAARRAARRAPPGDPFRPPRHRPLDRDPRGRALRRGRTGGRRRRRARRVRRRPRARARLGLGGLVAQLLLLDHPERLTSATLLATGPLPSPQGPRCRVRPPRSGGCGPSSTTRATARASWPGGWRTTASCTAATPRSTPTVPCAPRARDDPRGHRRAGHRARPPRRARPRRRAARRLGPDPGDRGAADPVFPPPSAAALADALGNGRIVRIPGLGHVLGEAVSPRLAEVVLDHTLSIPTSA